MIHARRHQRSHFRDYEFFNLKAYVAIRRIGTPDEFFKLITLVSILVVNEHEAN